eukprot:1094393-Rhodomonas_salina.1
MRASIAVTLPPPSAHACPFIPPYALRSALYTTRVQAKGMTPKWRTCFLVQDRAPKNNTV